MAFVFNNQLLLLLTCFVVGALAALTLYRKPAGHRAWRVADLVWVILGGIGALVAIVAGLYADDSSQLDRRIDVAYAATEAFDRDAARFRLRFCDPPHGDTLRVVCEQVEFLSASTAKNAELPLFISVTHEVAPYQGLRLFARRTDDRSRMEDMVDAFDPDQFLVFTALDTPTLRAVDALRADAPVIAGDYLILARSYDDLIEKVGALKTEWELLQQSSGILLLQICALCLVSFAAPFRLGRSIVELRRSPGA